MPVFISRIWCLLLGYLAVEHGRSEAHKQQTICSTSSGAGGTPEGNITGTSTRDASARAQPNCVGSRSGGSHSVADLQIHACK
jgi:hypothetical protein